MNRKAIILLSLCLCWASTSFAQSNQTSSGSATLVKTFKDCNDCPEMVVIPAGEFTMGSSEGRDDEKPAHTVSIPQPIAIGKTEVTQKQWRAVMGSNPSYFQGCDDCPVEQVSWNDAQEFITKLNAKTGKQYRLPSEAEWEYACRAGGRHEYCGSDSIDAVAWYDKNSGDKTHPVGQKQANAWGLYDISGNVWEWVQGCWNGNYNGASTDGSAWISGNCSSRVRRGGSWGDYAGVTRAAFRSDDTQSFRNFDLGFRLAKTLQ